MTSSLFGGPEGPSWGVLKAPLGAQVCQNGVTIIELDDLGGPSGPKIGPRPHWKAPKDPPGPLQDPHRTLQDAPRTPFKPSQEPLGPPRDTPRPPGTPLWTSPRGPGTPPGSVKRPSRRIHSQRLLDNSAESARTQRADHSMHRLAGCPKKPTRLGGMREAIKLIGFRHPMN